MQGSRTQIVVIIGVLLLGTLLRTWSLGAAPLSSDELRYHFAAQSLASSGSPTLPSGSQFEQGIFMTRVIALLQKTPLRAESTARLPSATLSTLALLLFAGFAWLVAGPWTAIGATFLLAVYPEAIRQGRTAGLYSFQHFCGVVAISFGWLATLRAIPRQASSPRDLIRRWIWAAVSVLAFAAAALAHLSALTVFAGLSAWVALLAGVALWTNRADAVRSNVAVQMMIAGLVGFALVLVARPDFFSALAHKVSTGPTVSSSLANGSGAGFFAQAIGSQFGWLLTLLPAIVLFVLRRNFWFVLYLTTWFLVPFLAHSFIVVRKEERLLLMALPALFLLGGLAIDEGHQAISRAVSNHLGKLDASYRTAQAIGLWTATALAVLSLVLLPALPISTGIPRQAVAEHAEDWGALRSVLTGVNDATRLPLGSSDPLVSAYYLSRSDFGVMADSTKLTSTRLAELSSRILPAQDSGLAADKLSGLPVAALPSQIGAAYPQSSDAYIVVRTTELANATLRPELRAALLDHATELCRGLCGSLRLYRLQLRQEPAADKLIQHN